ncbi:hypothetical protein ISF_02724 [Cordyceps fumosorosea ARSEF 2679]|uniref:Uncharacterized protein n=1 Tax=Cordyceps fumosorosea (strain ARSEF 2679) TaxID=1081104 RepID=A0A162LED8_CORFA|nr:hypothetical protein ISF_02724 [Cordyceps fumosorosea ARSEF 2679]OAA69454.1 hypothetical protein ISF_02724 [Cordyceps fumosorosea ARSEF 2679]
MTAATLNGASSTEDFESILDYLSTVGYDVAFLRGDARSLLADNPISESKGTEHFDPTVAPLGALKATGPWAARLLQGGGTFIDEVAGTATWPDSLDLPGCARRVAELTRRWMDEELPGEAGMIARAAEGFFPKTASVAEQFYTLRDSIHYSQQWLPGPPSSRPALTLILAFCIGVDEFFRPVESIDATLYLGRRVGDLWDECVEECGGREDAKQWIALAREALRCSVFLQNREKLAYMGLVENGKDIFTDWDTTAHYMLRGEAGMTPFAGLLMCAYAGLPFHESLAGAIAVYCYSCIFVLDFCKRATKLGAGSFTEVSLANKTAELQGRGQLIGAFMEYGESVLPMQFLCVLRPYVLASSSLVDVMDRYRERSWGMRLPVSRVTLCTMMAVLEAAGGSLADGGELRMPRWPSPNELTLVAEVVEMLDAEDAYEAYRAQPCVNLFYKLPHLVRVVLQMGSQHAPQSIGQLAISQATSQDAVLNGDVRVSQPTRWMTCLSTACTPPLPSAHKRMASIERRASRLGAVRLLGGTEKLQSLALRSPARPGGYAAGYREFTGRPVGSGTSS